MSTSDACSYHVKRTGAVSYILNGADEVLAAGKEFPSDV
jgi:hypothetical protein